MQSCNQCQYPPPRRVETNPAALKTKPWIQIIIPFFEADLGRGVGEAKARTMKTGQYLLRLFGLKGAKPGALYYPKEAMTS